MGRSRDQVPAVREKRKQATKRKETTKRTITKATEIASMEKQRIISNLSSSFFIVLSPILRQRRRAMEKLRLVNEALVAAEENIAKLKERHDMILKEICSYYLVNTELQEALVAARSDINDASAFLMELRRSQLNILNSLS